MIEDSDSLARATARSAAARQQLANTVVDLQSRLSPQRLLRDGARELRETATGVGRDAVDHVRANPGQIAGLIAALIVFLARDRIANAISSVGDKAVKPRRGRRVSRRTNISRKDRP